MRLEKAAACFLRERHDFQGFAGNRQIRPFVMFPLNCFARTIRSRSGLLYGDYWEETVSAYTSRPSFQGAEVICPLPTPQMGDHRTTRGSFPYQGTGAELRLQEIVFWAVTSARRSAAPRRRNRASPCLVPQFSSCRSPKLYRAEGIDFSTS